MITLNDVSNKISLGKAYYIQLLDENTALLKKGCCAKYTKQIRCLRMLIQALLWDVNGDYLTDNTVALYELLCSELANYTGSFLGSDPDLVMPGITTYITTIGSLAPPVDISYAMMSLAGTRYDNPLWAGLIPFMEVDNTTQLYYPADFTLISTGGFILNPGGSLPAIYPGQIIRAFNYAQA